MKDSAPVARISRFARPESQFQIGEMPRKEQVYELEIVTAVHDGREFNYFVGTKVKGEISVEALPAEFFGLDLQKCDTTDTGSLLDFCGLYGLVPSPLYDGASSFISFRDRTKAHPYSPHTGRVPAEKMNRADPTLHLILNSPDTLEVALSEDSKGARPRLLTEIARDLENDNKSARVVISEAELAQAIRALQCATAISSVYSYMSQEEINGSVLETIERMRNPLQLQQHGTDYFLHSDESIFKGYTPLTYEERLENDDAFAALVDNSELDNTEYVYYLAVADALRSGTQDALLYLSLADHAYRTASNTWAHSEERGFGTLGEIITAQFARCFVSDTPWRRCEFCGRIFKKYREEGFKKNIRATKFCKKSCNVMYIQRSKRS